MKTELPNLLGAVIRDYFMDHLPRLRGTSPHNRPQLPRQHCSAAAVSIPTAQ